MSRVEKIAEQLRTLSPAELRELRAWMDAHEDELWDERFGAEIASGKWDSLAAEALQDHRKGRTTPL